MEFQFNNVINGSINRGEIILNKKYLLYGYGISNQSVEKFFIKKKISYEILEEYQDIDLNKFDIIVKSPGIPFDDKLLIKAYNLNKLIISDIELFSYFYPNAYLIAITGTNGKTTTTLMIQSLLKHKRKVLVAGNIGIPIFDLDDTNNFQDEILILECSSYMLANTYYFHPKIAVITNIYPNHLDNHGTFSHYVNSKLKIIQNMKEDDILIYHESLDEYEDIKNFNGQKYKIIDNDNLLFFKKDDLYYQNKLLKKDYKKLYPGLHNLLNLKMAITCGNIFKLSFNKIKNSINSLVIPNFRLSKVYQKNNLIIYNDSKSTNQLALLSAIETLKSTNYSIYWIGGGKNRNEDWHQLEEVFKVIDKAFIFGENKYQIASVLNDLDINYILKNTLEEIITTLPKNFVRPTYILFSPASQSHDQYLNYIERGETFNKLIFEYYNE